MSHLKGLALSALLLAAAVESTAADEHPTWYAGVGLGETTIEVPSGIVQPSDPPQTQTFDESGDLTKVFIGYKPIKYFALEGSLMAAGDFTKSILESSPGAGVEGYDVSALGILALARASYRAVRPAGLAA